MGYAGAGPGNGDGETISPSFPAAGIDPGNIAVIIQDDDPPSPADYDRMDEQLLRESTWTPDGWIAPGEEAALEEAALEQVARIDRAVTDLLHLPRGLALLADLAEDLRSALTAPGTTTAPPPATGPAPVAPALADTAPDSPEESLALVAALARTRTRLRAREDEILVETSGRIREDNAALGKQGRHLEDGIIPSIAFAQRTSTHKTSRTLARARRIAESMPHLRRAQQTARLSEEVVSAIAGALHAETPARCRDIDEALHTRYQDLDGLGTRAITALVRDLLQQRSPREESVARAKNAAARRHVTTRATADGMGVLHAHLPALAIAQIEATIQATAETARAHGSQLGISALRADALLEAVNRLHDQTVHQDTVPSQGETFPETDTPLPLAELTHTTGPAAGPIDIDAIRNIDRAVTDAGAFGLLGTARGPDLTEPPTLQRPARRAHGPTLRVNVIITDRALLGRDDDTEPAQLSGYGTVPAHAIRAHLSGQPYDNGPENSRMTTRQREAAAAHAVACAELRRIWEHPASTEIMAIEKTSRAFRATLRDLIITRDHISREPYSNATTREIDHIDRHSDGGRTALDNGQGLDTRANHAKEEGRWTTIRHGDPTTPTGTTVEWTNPYQVRAPSPTPPTHRRP
ncbi:HNH endonuclease signature motif containing protein [Brachybacterium phenoliresistens]|uniref:HNH endonuclease signature motif containing protein n=1 Tax=Brachybacterium phenoliresistens TaxID=396014 RepID=UPI0031DE7420